MHSPWPERLGASRVKSELTNGLSYSNTRNDIHTRMQPREDGPGRRSPAACRMETTPPARCLLYSISKKIARRRFPNWVFIGCWIYKIEMEVGRHFVAAGVIFRLIAAARI